MSGSICNFTEQTTCPVHEYLIQQCLCRQTGGSTRLEIDGGIKASNIAAAALAGADTFVAGSAIFGSSDYRETIDAMRDALAGAGNKR